MQPIVLVALAGLLCTIGVCGDDVRRGETRPLSGDVFESATSRHLLTIPTIDDVKATCKTKASATLTLTRGRAHIKARSSCVAFAASISNIEEIVDDYIEEVKFNPGEVCKKTSIENVIQTCAQSIAKVYTEASVDIRVRGNARACASATSEGDAYAKAYAALLVNLWLGSSTGEDSAEAEAQVGTLNFALAKAWAEAKTTRCQKGTGSVQDFESSYANQVRVAITCVTVELATKLCNTAIKGKLESNDCSQCSNGELEGLLKATESTSEIGVCSKTFNLVDEKKGNAETEDRKSVICAGRKKKCCREFYNGRSQCLCGRKCFLKRTASGLWLNERSNKLCYCPDYKKLPFDEPLDK